MDATAALTLVVAHPALSTSFCGALVRRVLHEADQHGADAVVQDLYADGFDPVLTADEAAAVRTGSLEHEVDGLVAGYRRRLAETDVLVVVHPNWWGKPPALLSGWLDRVLVPGVAYKLSDGPAGLPEPLLRMRALVATTGDTPLDRERDAFGDPLAAIWERCVLPYLGATPVVRMHITPVHALSSGALSASLEQVGTAVRELIVPGDLGAP